MSELLSYPDEVVDKIAAVLSAARSVAMTHHGQWNERLTSNRKESIPMDKLERLRDALEALDGERPGKETPGVVY